MGCAYWLGPDSREKQPTGRDRLCCRIYNKLKASLLQISCSHSIKNPTHGIAWEFPIFYRRTSQPPPTLLPHISTHIASYPIRKQ